ncbi:MAG: Mov34/MPN/PAD-1 family protein [Candidatus Kryptoniota bacterium]
MIRITKESILQIEKHGERAYPEECCGIMLGINDGNDRGIEEVFGLDNEQGENRQRRFFVTPKQYLQAERIAVERKLQLLGFYHSHPDHPAAPSEFDRDHALPWFTYLIVSVAQGKAKDITAWFLNETRERFDKSDLLMEVEREKVRS